MAFKRLLGIFSAVATSTAALARIEASPTNISVAVKSWLNVPSANMALMPPDTDAVSTWPSDDIFSAATEMKSADDSAYVSPIRRWIGEPTTTSTDSSSDPTPYSSSISTPSALPWTSGLPPTVDTPFTDFSNGLNWTFHVYFGYAQKGWKDGSMMDLTQLRHLILHRWNGIHTGVLERKGLDDYKLYQVTKDETCATDGYHWTVVTPDLPDKIQNYTGPGRSGILTPLAHTKDLWLFKVVISPSCLTFDHAWNELIEHASASSASPAPATNISINSTSAASANWSSVLITTPAPLRTQWTSHAPNVTVIEPSKTDTMTTSSLTASTSSSGEWIFEPSTTLSSRLLITTTPDARSTFVELNKPISYDPSTSSTLASTLTSSDPTLNLTSSPNTKATAARPANKRSVHNLAERHGPEETGHTITKTVTVACISSSAAAQPDPTSTKTITVDSTSTKTRTTNHPWWIPSSDDWASAASGSRPWDSLCPTSAYDFTTTTWTPGCMRTETSVSTKRLSRD